jgi:hypothetical protein
MTVNHITVTARELCSSTLEDAFTAHFIDQSAEKRTFRVTGWKLDGTRRRNVMKASVSIIKPCPQQTQGYSPALP